MRIENTERLLRDFPDLFISKQLTHGFECQDGWFGLIYELSIKIREYHAQCSEIKPFEILRFSQKTGGLRIGIKGGDDALSRLIQEAEQKSHSI